MSNAFCPCCWVILIVSPFLFVGFGLMQAIGDVDFYPNGGQHQPGCPPETLGLIGMLSFEGTVVHPLGLINSSRVVQCFDWSSG